MAGAGIEYQGMSEPRPFEPVKFIVGLIYVDLALADEAAARLERLLGPLEYRSPAFDFSSTDYYADELGPGIKRVFLSFERTGRPEDLADLKLATNRMELEIGGAEGRPGRAVNIDPGYMTSAALFMATAKNFAHRVPLKDGIYAHLEVLFTRRGPKFLEWTYPDFRTEPGYTEFFLKVRKGHLEKLIRDGYLSRARGRQ